MKAFCTNMTPTDGPEYLEDERMPPLAEHTRIGRLLLVSSVRKPGDRKDYWECVCDCGVIKIVRGDSLRAGRTKSCGCQQHTPTVGRRNQMSSYRMPEGAAVYVIHGYHGQPTRPGSDRRLASTGFGRIEVVGGGPGEYYLTRCISRPVPKGGEALLWKVGLAKLHGLGLIGPRDGMTIPRWSRRYGVEYVPALRSGESHIRAMYEEMKATQDFGYRDI